MLEKPSFQTGSSFTYGMYITAGVGHLHENGRLSERDKPTASSRELDAVFGIPSSGWRLLRSFFSSVLRSFASYSLLLLLLLPPCLPPSSPPLRPDPDPSLRPRPGSMILAVQGLLKYCRDPGVWLELQQHSACRFLRGSTSRF